MSRIVMLLSNPYRPDPRVRREALALQEEGYGVRVYAWDREDQHPPTEDDEGIEIRRIRLRCSYDDVLEVLIKLPLVWAGMLARLLPRDFDVVHCHDLDTLPLGLFLARLKGRPCVFDAHEVYSIMVSESVPKGLKGPLQWIERRLVRVPELVITVNDTLSQLYRRMGARETVVVMNSSPPEDVSGGDPEALRRALGLEGEGLCLYLGMLERSRNLDTVLEAFDGLGGEDIVLVLGGFGTLIDHIRRRASELGNVAFVGWVPPEEKTSYLAAADVVLLLDDPGYPANRVATPTRLLEALARGIPVLASEGTSTAEIVREEGVGLRVRHDDPEDIRRGVRELLSNAELRAASGRNGRRAAREKYSWEATVERLLATYRDLTS